MICCDYYKLLDMFHLPGCHHEYCKNCMADHLKVKVSDGKVVKIGCMEYKCDQVFTIADIKSFGSEEIYKKYLRFKENIDVEVNPSLKWCPQVDCMNFVKREKFICCCDSSTATC